MVLIKNLAEYATSDQQKRNVLHIDNKPRLYRTFLGLGGMAHSVMNSNTNITLPLIYNFYNPTSKYVAAIPMQNSLLQTTFFMLFMMSLYCV